MRIDGFRAKDLDPLALVFLGAGVLIGSWAVGDAIGTVLFSSASGPVAGSLAIGLAAFAVFGFFAYEHASPEFDGECDACGAPIRVNSGTDRRDGVLKAQETKPPRRLELGPVSLVLKRRKREHVYCSVGCVERDAPQVCVEHVGVVDDREAAGGRLPSWNEASDEEVAD